MKYLTALKLIIELLKLIGKDTDGDGRPDLFDSEPTNQEIK